MISYLSSPLTDAIGRTRIACSTPWALIDAASSFNAPSSIRVRGWYLPACSALTLSVVGAPATAGTSKKKSEEPPSNASRPRPSPLCFFVAIFLILISSLMSPRLHAPQLKRLQSLDAIDHFGPKSDISLRAL